MKTRIICCVAVCLAFGSARAAELGRSVPEVVYDIRTPGRSISTNKATGLQLAFVEPLQIFPKTYDVFGLRLNILYGRNQNLRGLDCGVVNVGEGLMEGLQVGAANWVSGLAGAQIGAYNMIEESVQGSFQLGAFNNAYNFLGLQLGAVNHSQQVHGVQIGLINMCVTIDGVQIGIINIISQSEFLVFSPLFNAQF